MLENSTEGIWCREDNTWYYLETGPYYKSSNLDKIKRILMARGKSMYTTERSIYGAEPYKVLTYLEAKERQYPIQAIYLNQHIKTVATEAKQNAVAHSPWD